MSHNDDKLGLYAVLGFGFGLYTFYKGFRQFRDYRLVADTPEIPIRSIPMGFVEVRGVAKGEQIIPSPVSHTPCLAYKVVIEKWKTEGRGGGSWGHHRTDIEGPLFYLTDAGGKVLVDPRQADLDLPPTAQRQAGGGHSYGSGPGASEQELLQYVSQADMRWMGNLAQRGLAAVGPLSDPQHEQTRQSMLTAAQHPPGSPDFMRQMAVMMAPQIKQKLEAMGPQSDPQKEQGRQMALQAFQHPPGSPEFMQGLQQAAEVAGEQQQAQHLAAMMQGNAQGTGVGFYSAASGRYRLTEFCLVPEGTYEVSGTCMENPNCQDEYDRNLITKGTNEQVFLISSKQGKQMKSGMRNSALKKIFGGAALAVICLAIVLAKLGLF